MKEARRQGGNYALEKGKEDGEKLAVLDEGREYFQFFFCKII